MPWVGPFFYESRLVKEGSARRSSRVSGGKELRAGRRTRWKGGAPRSASAAGALSPALLLGPTMRADAHLMADATPTYGARALASSHRVTALGRRMGRRGGASGLAHEGSMGRSLGPRRMGQQPGSTEAAGRR